MTVLEVRALSPDVLRGYLIDELAGVEEGDGSIAGEGWRVRVVPLPPTRVGRLAVPATRIEIDGAREPEVAGFLRFKTMRGGG